MLNNNLLSNEKINHNPLVLVNTLFKVVKHKTDIQGFWQDGSRQLYIDNIETVKYSEIDTCYFINAIKVLFLLGEKSVFYKNVYNQGVLEYADGSIDTLKKRIVLFYETKPCQLDIQCLLKKYNGLTVYKIDNGNYLLEIYT